LSLYEESVPEVLPLSFDTLCIGYIRGEVTIEVISV
jgi:hypothetical protein